MDANPDVGLVIDAIVALVALEALLLVAVRAVFGIGPARFASVANCASGAALLLALRAAIGGAQFPVIGFFLFLSLIAHAADLAARWRDPARSRTAHPLSPSASAALASERSRV